MKTVSVPPTMQATYEAAYAAFVPEENDLPENIRYYRAAAGLKAVLGDSFVNEYNGAYHQMFCCAGSVPVEDGLEVALITLQDMADKSRMPVEPRPSYSYRCEPDAPSDSDVREYFNREYKRAYPDNRLNSKHARDMWASHEAKARQILTAQYETRLAEYHAQEAALEAKNESLKAAWREECAKVERFRAAVANIIKQVENESEGQ